MVNKDEYVNIIYSSVYLGLIVKGKVKVKVK